MCAPLPACAAVDDGEPIANAQNSGHPANQRDQRPGCDTLPVIAIIVRRGGAVESGGSRSRAGCLLPDSGGLHEPSRISRATQPTTPAADTTIHRGTPVGPWAGV